jgi:hypothetical protein
MLYGSLKDSHAITTQTLDDQGDCEMVDSCNENGQISGQEAVQGHAGDSASASEGTQTPAQRRR